MDYGEYLHQKPLQIRAQTSKSRGSGYAEGIFRVFLKVCTWPPPTMMPCVQNGEYVFTRLYLYTEVN